MLSSTQIFRLSPAHSNTWKDHGKALKKLCFFDYRYRGSEALTRSAVGDCMEVPSMQLICNRKAQLFGIYNQVLTHDMIPASRTSLEIDLTCDLNLLD